MSYAKTGLKTVRITFIVILISSILVTIIWRYFLISGQGNFLFIGNNDFQFNKKVINRIIYLLIFIYGFWSYGFYLLKHFLLKKIGFNKKDLTSVFSNRTTGFNLQSLLSKYSERKIRIIDMIARRGRILPVLLQSFIITYLFLGKNPTQISLTFAFENSMIISLIILWIHIMVFFMNGPLGHIYYGAHTRIMDGVKGRANVLLILTLWQSFQFVLVPLSFFLASVFPPTTYAILYAMILFPYIAVDSASEIFGSLFGKQKIKVWGLGDVNRKSIAGTIAGFIFGLVISLGIVSFSVVPSSWFILAFIIPILATIIELYSPRGSDDFFMLIGNALICLIFGIIIY